jgi:hypothetical protein
LAKLDEETAAATRADLGRERFSGRLRLIEVELAGPSHYVPAAQVREHTI